MPIYLQLINRPHRMPDDNKCLCSNSQQSGKQSSAEGFVFFFFAVMLMIGEIAFEGFPVRVTTLLLDVYQRLVLLKKRLPQTQCNAMQYYAMQYIAIYVRKCNRRVFLTTTCLCYHCFSFLFAYLLIFIISRFRSPPVTSTEAFIKFLVDHKMWIPQKTAWSIEPGH